MILLEVLVDYVQQAAPEGALAIHPSGRLAERLGLGVSVGAPVDRAGDDAGLLEHLQVLGDRGLGDAEAGRDVPDRRRPGGEALDDAAADRVGEALNGSLTI